MRHSLLLSSLAVLFALGCGDKDMHDDDGTGTDDTGSAGDDGGGDEGGDDGDDGSDIEGTVGGTVTVELFQYDAEGDEVALSWEDGTGGEFPYGKIFVAAYYENDDGGREYVAEHVIESPTTAPNAYDLEIELDEDRELYVYAVLDYYQDNIVGSNEPKGVYPEAIEFTAGTDFDEGDIVIKAGLYGGGGGCDITSLAGDIDLTVSWNSGELYAMLLTTTGLGPLYADITEPTSAGAGASGPYGISACENTGEVNLIGAWDSNGNGMADPLDQWGSYVVAGADANPVDVSTGSLSGYDIEVPFGDNKGIEIVPFVRLIGSVNVDDGTFDDLDPGSELYVAALKYKPSGEFSAADLASAYDYDAFTWPELTGQTDVGFSLNVPANTVVYLWAFVDDDADGTLNEPDDYIGTGGGANGKLGTGTESSTDLEIALSTITAE